MPPKPESSTAYRDRVEDEDDDDDLDDLDDVLASFNQPSKPKPAQAPTSQATTRVDSSTAETIGSKTKASVSDEGEGEGEGGEDFEASLVEGMESLLRQLAGDNPPGPMPGTTSTSAGAGMTGGSAGKGLSADDEEKAFQRAIEMMLSKEGIDALGLEDDEDGFPTIPPSQGKSEATSSSSKSTSKPPPNPNPNSNGSSNGPNPASFEETIRKAMESLNTAGEKKPGTGGDGMGGMGGIPSDPAELAKLLAQLGNDPSLDLEGDDELSGILDGMMGQLMTREVLEEPMSELASKYPEYLASPPATVSPPELEKYKQQSRIVQTIVDTFRKPGYTDEKDGKEIGRLVGEMQDLGGPPQEIMGDLPEGFDLGALAGDESCTIM